MKPEIIEKIFNFLKEKEGQEIPKKWADTFAKYEKKKELIRVLENHPDGIQYRHNGNLILSRTNIKKLPNDLYVGGYFSIQETNITKLPDKLYVKYSMMSGYCQQLTELPDNLYVEDDLVIHGSNIREIPNNLYVGHSLFIADTPLANKYTNEEIREMITSKGGTMIGKIS